MKTVELLNQLSLKMTKTEIQDYLETNHKIHSKIHPSDGRIILDYDHIDSVKSDEIARECRGLVLDDKFNLVGRSFKRFFNAGEHTVDDKSFNWDMPVLMTDKEDGTMIVLSYHDNQWKITTRFSFADHPIDDSGILWSDLFYLGFNKELLDYLDTQYTYVFELCSKINRVVRHYQNPTVYLLTVFLGSQELHWEATASIALDLGLSVPKSTVVSDIFEAQRHLTLVVENDNTFEGYVLRDCHNNRLKMKSPIYLKLHKRIGNRKFTTEDYVTIYLDGQGSEFVQYFPEIIGDVQKVGVKYNLLKSHVIELFNKANKPNSSQREFAMRVKDSPYSSFLFQMRKGVSFDIFFSNNIPRYAHLLDSI